MGLYGSPELFPGSNSPRRRPPTPIRPRGFWTGFVLGACTLVVMGSVLAAGHGQPPPGAAVAATASPAATPTSVPSCACGPSGPSGPPGGLPSDAAIAAAQRLAPPAAAEPAAIWASIEQDPFASSGPSDARLVWEVRLQGSFAVSPCPSGFLNRPPSLGDTACLDGDSGLIVVLDYFSGALVGWTH